MALLYREDRLSGSFETLPGRERICEDCKREKIKFSCTHEVRRISRPGGNLFLVTQRPASPLQRSKTPRMMVPVGRFPREYEPLIDSLEEIEEETGRILVAILK